MQESYVYFGLKSKNGKDINMDLISKRLSIKYSNITIKGHNSRILKTQQKEYFNINELVKEVINPLYEKIKTINEIKEEFELYSILEIVMCINTKEGISTPYLGYDNKTIEFLYKTGTTSDIDIYTFLQ